MELGLGFGVWGLGLGLGIRVRGQGLGLRSAVGHGEVPYGGDVLDLRLEVGEGGDDATALRTAQHRFVPAQGEG